jgi:hypothetical protein
MQSCLKEPIDDGLEYEILKAEITEKYKNHPRFTWDQYQAILIELSKDKYVVLPVYEMKDYFDTTKVVVCLRHDVDVQIFKAQEMCEMEYFFGIRSTYYILATARYYGRFVNNILIRNICMGEAYLKLNYYGHEIGIHNDMLTVMIKYGYDPLAFNKQELDYYASLGIPIYGTASHGSEIARQTVANYQIFSDLALQANVDYKGVTYNLGQHSLEEFGFSYEAYFIDYNKYFSEAGGDWNFDDDYDGMMRALKNSVPGDRIQILTHPAYWGK